MWSLLLKKHDPPTYKHGLSHHYLSHACSKHDPPTYKHSPCLKHDPPTYTHIHIMLHVMRDATTTTTSPAVQGPRSAIKIALAGKMPIEEGQSVTTHMHACMYKCAHRQIHIHMHIHTHTQICVGSTSPPPTKHKHGGQPTKTITTHQKRRGASTKINTNNTTIHDRNR